MAMRNNKFEVYKALDGWRWRLKSRNGRIIADSGQAYSSKRKATEAASNVWDIIIENRVVLEVVSK